MIAKFTCPCLLLLLSVLLNLAVHIKDSLALRTKNGVSSCQFPLIFKTLHRYLENISINLFFVLLLLFVFQWVIWRYDILRMLRHTYLIHHGWMVNLVLWHHWLSHHHIIEFMSG